MFGFCWLAIGFSRSGDDGATDGDAHADAFGLADGDESAPESDDPPPPLGLGGAGGVTYVNTPVPVPATELGFVTTMSTTPAARAPVVQGIDVAEMHVTGEHATPPTVTVEPEENPVPVIVTTSPPSVDPVVGDALLTVGGT